MALTKTDKEYISSQISFQNNLLRKEIKQKFDRLEVRVERLEERIEQLEVRVDKLDGNIMKLSIDVEKNSKDIQKVYEMTHKNGILLEEIRDHFKFLAEGHMGTVRKLDDHEERINVLEKRP